uniref:MYND-type domain-containing protein n=1 Tax=Mycena chlorophos TaxID=658473 RepID=A0ABQ0KU65_MYCCL|nr:predicted protein [Mycena chlorophos]
MSESELSPTSWNANASDQPTSTDLARPVFQLTRRSDCYQCKKPRPAKMCAACGVACYCDAKCQRLHWPEHKEGCRRQRDDMKSLSPENARKVAEGSGFFDFWREPLVRWAAYCINLGAREPDFLINCTFMAVFGRREDPPSEAAKFAYELGSSGMILDSDIPQALLEICTTDMVDLVVKRLAEMPRGPFLIHSLVGSGNIWTCYAIDIRTVFSDYDFHGAEL